MIYCRDCGQPYVSYNTKKFDTKTGKPIISERCENLKCESGCWNLTYHKETKGFFSNTCKNCGYIHRDY